MIYDNREATILVHKKESTSRIKTYSIDRLKIREKLVEYIHHLDSESYPKSLISVVTDRIYSSTYNFDQFVKFENDVMTVFLIWMA